jgi:hypothetical protein
MRGCQLRGGFEGGMSKAHNNVRVVAEEEVDISEEGLLMLVTSFRGGMC